MSITSLALVLLVLLALSLLVHGAFLWFGARLGRIPNASYHRSLLATLVAYLFGWLLTALAAVAVWNVPGLLSPSMEWPFLAVQIVVTVVSIKWLLHTTWGKALLAWVVSFLLASVYAAALVFVLKTWVMEGFVIPTGGMAETLWGYHKSVACPQCGQVFPVNASAEADPYPGRPPRMITGCMCPNCRYGIDFAADRLAPALETGDRLLVTKLDYGNLERLQPVIFRNPVAPVLNGVPIIYVKRLVGRPGETIAIHRGKLYTCRDLLYDWRERPASPEAAREVSACYGNDERAIEAFKQGKFEIIRKPPDRLLALSRLVYDNDHQATDLAGKPEMRRWQADKSWKPDHARLPRRFDLANDAGWLRYRHILRDNPGTPQLVTDFMGYNTGHEASPLDGGRLSLSQNWVSDLILECDVELTASAKGGHVVLELAKGPDRFQAKFDTVTGECKLLRHRTIGPMFDKELASQPGTRLKGTGKHHVRLANVDDRLTLWVDDDLPFGDGVAYEPAKEAGPENANDLQPAAIGAQGSVAISKLLLRRDTYYTVDPSSADVSLPPNPNNPGLEPWANPEAWGPLQKRPMKTFFVQPGHYFCLGDNSPESADSRIWGLVPEPNMLGPAVLTYWPLPRSGWIR